PGSLAGLFDPPVPVDERALEDLPVKSFLGWEMVQQARPANPDRGGDVVERSAVVAVLREAPRSLSENRLPGREAVVGAGKEALRPLRQRVQPCADGS